MNYLKICAIIHYRIKIYKTLSKSVIDIEDLEVWAS